MKLVDVVRPECVLPQAQFDGKEQALEAVAATALKCSALQAVSRESLVDALKQREALGSTGFGNGIAIPHCRTDDANEFVVGIITVPDGVPFDTLDGEPVRVIVFIIAPTSGANGHIKLLSAISRTLSVEGAVRELVAAQTPEALVESFLRFSAADIDTTQRDQKNLVHVFVQEEDVFRQIVEMLAALESASLVIIDAENARPYLAKMPLFAGFWHDEPSGFARVIVVTVDRKLTNETLRRIESITGDLDKRTDTMIAVQELYYLAGSLGA